MQILLMYVKLLQKLASTSFFTLGITHLILASVRKIFAESDLTDLYVLGIANLTLGCVFKVFC